MSFIMDMGKFLFSFGDLTTNLKSNTLITFIWLLLVSIV